MPITEEERTRRKQLYDRKRYLERKAKGEIKKTKAKTARNKTTTTNNTSKKNTPEPRYKNRSETYNSKFAREEGSKFIYMNVYVGKDALNKTSPDETIKAERMEDLMAKLDGLMKN